VPPGNSEMIGLVIFKMLVTESNVQVKVAGMLPTVRPLQIGFELLIMLFYKEEYGFQIGNFI
jgi:hypothetical protein